MRSKRRTLVFPMNSYTIIGVIAHDASNDGNVNIPYASTGSAQNKDRLPKTHPNGDLVPPNIFCPPNFVYEVEGTGNTVET